MPQHTQHSLVYVLLMWTTLNTIIQVIFISLFFTVGRNELSLNCSTYSSTIEPKHNTQSQDPSSGELLLGKGKMINFVATKALHSVTWASPSSIRSVISVSENGLLIQTDGDYFLNLQVTLTRRNEEHTVQLLSKDKVLLEGWINTKTNSTGALSKMHELSAGAYLKVKIDPPTEYINLSDSVTHLGIIFMDKPHM